MQRLSRALWGAVLISLLCAGAISAQVEVIDGFVLYDLHLISQESLAHWTPRWTGPIQAATILALLAELGHPRLIDDLNGDGVIDELDTILLADSLGKGTMRTETTRGTNDARLVLGLARYVADRYPDEFVLKIYDEGFPAEFQAETGQPFAPDAIAGIVLRAMPEPSVDAYKTELESLEGVILGLEEDPDRNNTYLSGRSLLFEETPEGYTPIDLAWAAEDRWTPGAQGQVLETVGWMADRFYVEFRGDWMPVEILLALSPQERPGLGDGDHECPDDAIAYDVTRTPTPHGEVEVEECVERLGDVDRYTWTVANIDYLVDGCGICMFAVPNPGLPILGHSQPPGVAFSPSPWALRWFAHLGSCGILPGASGVFSVSFPAPTIDVAVPGAVGGCSVPGPCKLSLIEVDSIRTTGPMAAGDCPDLVVTIDDWSCTCRPLASAPSYTCQISVWVHIENVGAADVTVPTTVRLQGLAPYTGSVSEAPVPPLVSGGGHAVMLQFTVTASEPPCPIGFAVTADASGVVAECDEANTVTGSACCRSVTTGGACCLPDGSCVQLTQTECEAAGGDYQGNGVSCATVKCPGPSGCPDLTVYIYWATCSCSCSYTPGMVPVCAYRHSLLARITNAGSAPSAATTATLWPGGETESVPALAPGGHVDVTIEYEVPGGRQCEPLEELLTLQVTPVPGECDVTNNAESRSVTCTES